ncbi:hypothetical protein [Saliphagus sp. LR7]|uniref:hypothetical protein n=1 Tax=Saliphagus sp. LR7 TaxID=2282654 RepID=UPI0013008C9F|nr:hypothetical protein [Saliphagus sp. LR7]
MSKCYLLGAGASYGSRDSIPEGQRPPMGEYLFVDGWDSGLLRKEHFNPLFREVKRYAGIDGQVIDEGELEFNSEIFLKELDEEFSLLQIASQYQSLDDLDESEEVKQLQEHLRNRPEIEDDGIYERLENDSFPEEVKSDYISNLIQLKEMALSLSYYYFYEIFRQYSKEYYPKRDNYTNLANHVHTTNSTVLSLNYDIMFEKAIKSENLDYVYKGHPYSFYVGPRHRSESISLIKLHGSINWMNPFSMIEFGNGQPFHQRVKFIHSNSVQTKCEYIDNHEVESMDYEQLVHRSGGIYEPALIPPFEGRKDYEKVQAYDKIWSSAGHFLENTDELVVIGSRISPQDSKLIELIDTNMEKDSTITLVCGSSSNEIQTRLSDRFDHLNIETDCLRFGEYMDSLTGT